MTEKFYTVTPKQDCPHLASCDLKDLSRFNSVQVDDPCHACQDRTENWLCMQCTVVACSRRKQSHMLAHNETTKHPLVLSFSDLSVWCYGCDSYVYNSTMRPFFNLFQNKKFPEPAPDQPLVDAFAGLSLNPTLPEPLPIPVPVPVPPVPPAAPGTGSAPTPAQADAKPTAAAKPTSTSTGKAQGEEVKTAAKALTLEEVVQKLKSGACKNVVVLTGAGISVAAGIPDFRTPGTGLYSQLAKYNLPFAEAVFTLDYFKTNPEPFYKLASEMIGKKYLPTKAHYFIKLLANKGILKRNYTQNIDDLERVTGLSNDLLIQAHGTYTSGHCTGCHKEVDTAQLLEKMKAATPMLCSTCNAICKPDIVFFGESLPTRFFENISELKHECDLLIIMGSSLVVVPFSILPTLVERETPKLVINFELPEGLTFSSTDEYVHMPGDCEASIDKLVKLLGWESEFEVLMKERAAYAATHKIAPKL